MVLPVGLKMFRKLRDALTQQGDLHFRRSRISFTTLISNDYLPLYVSRQCHARVVAPCLLFISFLVTEYSIPQARRRAQWGNGSTHHPRLVIDCYHANVPN